MENRKIVDITVTEFMELLKGIHEKKYEVKCINEFLSIKTCLEKPEHGQADTLWTASQILGFVNESTGKNYTNMKSFGTACKKVFGKSKMKRGIGYVYEIEFKTRQL